MSRVPCKRTIYRVVEIFRTTCSVLNKDELRNSEWSPTCPDLIPCQYYLWGAWKQILSSVHILCENRNMIFEETLPVLKAKTPVICRGSFVVSTTPTEKLKNLLGNKRGKTHSIFAADIGIA
jgi:hypothetical protein